MPRQILPLTALFAAALAFAPSAHAASVTASAWSYETTDSHAGTTVASAAISRQALGAPGESHAAGSAGYGSLGGFSSIRGCGSASNNFQQVCNDAGSHAGIDDTLYITSDYPDSWAIQARATVSVTGYVNGHGGYSYSSTGWIEGQAAIASGSTLGTVQVFANQAVADTRVFDITLYSGRHERITHSLDTDAFQRDCAGGTQDCYDSEHNWTIAIGVTSTLQIEILTTGIHAHIASASGHDYTLAAVGVGREAASRTQLGPAWPNPARSGTHLALTLAEDANVDAGVFDVAGRRVATLAHGALDAGTHMLGWDGRDAGGQARSGMFLVRARGAGVDLVRRVIVVR